MTTTYFTRGLDSIRIDTASANITTAKRVRDMVHEDYDFRYESISLDRVESYKQELRNYGWAETSERPSAFDPIRYPTTQELMGK